MTANTPEANTQQQPKQKLRSIMEAASALTALGDEDSDAESPKQETMAMAPVGETPKEQATSHEKSVEAKEPTEAEKASSKRYLPEHKKPDAAPTFPEKLMNLMRFAEEEGKDDKDYCVAWLPDGKSFVIRNPDEYTRHLVPKYFKATKFSSFTRKLYRWGFRQINRGIGPDDPIIFGNDFFERDNEALMSKMRSITAAGTRKQEQSRAMAYGKRTFDGMGFDAHQDQKRFMFDQMMHHNKTNLMQQQNFYGGMGQNGTMPLSNALRPGMGMDPNQQQQQQQHFGNPGGGMSKPYEMMQQQHMQAPPMMMGGGIPYQHQNMQQQPMHQQQGPSMPPQQHQGPQQGNQQGMPNGQGFPNSQSTAEIVNAAIAALRYAN